MVVHALPSFQDIRKYAEQHHDYNYDKQPLDNTNYPQVTESLIEQKVDHFDRSAFNTSFNQRYFVNEEFFDGTGPVFFCVGGEGPPLTKSVLVASDHCNDAVELAPSVGALLVSLEHRYYGPSVPENTNTIRNGQFTNENLVHLNTEQALGDIANFITFINTQFKLNEENKWFTFGGSYPGMLSALSRLRYPHLIYGSVSSSAPLKAQVDMQGYNDVVAEALAAVSVGGSSACASVVSEGHKQIGNLLLTDEGRRSLESTFNICNPESKPLDDSDNQMMWAGNGVVYIPAQSNDPACTSPYCNIEQICSFLTTDDGSSEMDKLMKLSSQQHNDNCVSVNYKTLVMYYSYPKNPGRSWLFQTCNEWGFYQSCEENTKCPYTQGLHKFTSDLNLCETAFNISPDNVVYNIENALSLYGGYNIKGNRIMFLNGEVDPWKANGVSSNPSKDTKVINGDKSNNKKLFDKDQDDLHHYCEGEPSFLVTGASHHYWTHAAQDTDSPEILAAKDVIWKQVTAWIKE